MEKLWQHEIVEVGKEYLLTDGSVVEALALLPESVIVRYAGCYKKMDFHKDHFLDAICINEYTDQRKEYMIEIPTEPEPAPEVQDTSYELD
ncbi:hypothetical protein KNV05_gp112 [Vibrio phage River4]|uniref:Uncharacterized protein n=1 Tax=Vibrio phage River4 TaxID=2736288 RepID=A0A6M9Z0V7_9CAUD|nr:hypothetical protein KNV05_gp112 [Vibrio phage River4]QKN84843.1 hypothetical protein RIVER4_204 [Vibrio phage River4]